MDASDQYKCCTTGHIHSGTPVGTITEIAGLQTYVARNAHSNGRAVLFVSDAFGLPFINNQLLADTYAAQAQVDVYLPDFLEGDGVPVSAMNNISQFDFASWRAKHGRDKYSLIENYATVLRQQENIRKLAAVGFCWGAFGSIMLGGTDLIDAVVVHHPSLVSVPEDIEKLKKPILFNCAETDHAFPDDKRTASQQILEKNGIPATFKVYPGTQHGFAVRFSADNTVAASAAQEAKNHTVQFFKQYLV